jgi:hypothetical protein
VRSAVRRPVTAEGRLDIETALDAEDSQQVDPLTIEMHQITFSEAACQRGTIPMQNQSIAGTQEPKAQRSEPP